VFKGDLHRCRRSYDRWTPEEDSRPPVVAADDWSGLFRRSVFHDAGRRQWPSGANACSRTAATASSAYSAVVRDVAGCRDGLQSDHRPGQRGLLFSICQPGSNILRKRSGADNKPLNDF